MNRETNSQTALMTSTEDPWGPRTDTRLVTSEVKKAAKDAMDYVDGYWNGVLCCRADPCIRALRVYFNEDTKKPHHRLFSYDEIIATAALIKMGVPKRIAAAMAFFELAIAVPQGSSFKDNRDASDFEAVRVCLDDGSMWDVAFENDFRTERLKYVGDFAVWFDENGARSDPDEQPFPSHAIRVVKALEVQSTPPPSVH